MNGHPQRPIKTYKFSDWQNGERPPKGWDAADAIRDGWVKADLDAFMRATVRPWTPPENPSEKPAEKAAPRPADPPAGQPRPAREARTTQQEQPEPDAGVFHITGMARFDLELESWLTARRWAIRLNLLSGAIEVHRPGGVVPLTDERLAEIRFTFTYASNGKEPAKDKVADALALIGERRAYHPVRDYLDALQWDGVPRLDGWLARYAGAAETDLHAAFSRKMLCAAVRRARDPGCKFDHILVLQGQQDLGKSSLIRSLCHDPAWFTDQAKVGADAKETIERTSGAWLVELAELDGLGRREANAVKSFVTTVTDKARPAYGRYTIEKPRQFVLFGTTNESAFLTDLTGNRRWWLVKVKNCDIAGLKAVRDQLWAEAAQVEPDESLWLESDALKAEAAALTEAAADRGPWFDILADKIPSGPIKIAAADAWGLVGIDAQGVNKISPGHRASLRKALAGLGFDPDAKNIRRDGRQIHAYVRGDQATAQWWWPGSSASEGTHDPWW
jgi:hypothetical protein